MAKGEKTGGRTAGTPNKLSRARRKAAEEAAAKIEQALGKDAFQGDAHALLVATYKDKKQPIGIRIDAAKAAIPYERPRLSAIAHSGSIGQFDDVAAAERSRRVLEEVQALIDEETRKAV